MLSLNQKCHRCTFVNHGAIRRQPHFGWFWILYSFLPITTQCAPARARSFQSGHPHGNKLAHSEREEHGGIRRAGEAVGCVARRLHLRRPFVQH